MSLRLERRQGLTGTRPRCRRLGRGWQSGVRKPSATALTLSLRTSQPETAQRGGCVKVSNAESRPGPPGSPQPHPCGFWAPEDTACPLPTRTCSQEARGSPTGLLTTKDPHGVQRRWGVNLASHPNRGRKGPQANWAPAHRAPASEGAAHTPEHLHRASAKRQNRTCCARC